MQLACENVTKVAYILSKALSKDAFRIASAEACKAYQDSEQYAAAVTLGLCQVDPSLLVSPGVNYFRNPLMGADV